MSGERIMGRMNEPLCYNNIFQGTWGVACERADEWEGGFRGDWGIGGIMGGRGDAAE